MTGSMVRENGVAYQVALVLNFWNLTLFSREPNLLLSDDRDVDSRRWAHDLCDVLDP